MRIKLLKSLLYGLLTAFTMGLMVGCEGTTGEAINVLEQENLELESERKEDNVDVEDVNGIDYMIGYTEQMKVVEESIVVNSEIITEMSRMINDNPQIIKDEDFLNRLNRLIDAMDKNYFSVRDISPPDLFVDYHTLILGSLEEYSNGVKLFESGISNGDSKVIDESLEHFINAIKLNNEATNELIKITE